MPPKFHPDFKSPTGIVLQSSDDTCFAFNGHVLAFLSPFFADLLKVPAPADTKHNPIPTGVGTDALALALTLIEEGMSYRLTTPRPKWPTTDVLSDLLTLVDAYELTFVADELLSRTSAIVDSHTFDRYAFARASEWAKTVLDDHNKLAELYKTHLDHTVSNYKRQAEYASSTTMRKKKKTDPRTMPVVKRDADAAAITLESSDGVRFTFNPHLLAHVSPFFADLFKVPPPPCSNANPIPIAISADALELCLDLIREGMNHRRENTTRWPTTKVLDDVIKFVDKYDMSFVADELLALTRDKAEGKRVDDNDPFKSTQSIQAFERYAFACATKSPYVVKELSNTLRYNHRAMSKWAEKTLKNDPLALAELYKAHLDKRPATSSRPAASPFVPASKVAAPAKRKKV
ncbi:uncharacterized protein LOC62_04G006587 [Vanrija pseudolonga]|uniref:BTB domain-containing protein n=1 Tax=Vanrija pseudolonga TaxID=143232 RepID=A0AAF0YE06_9TREE|nr:hypothetical protein LOC62_04G006587 [Vanrija pseudolonga]